MEFSFSFLCTCWDSSVGMATGWTALVPFPSGARVETGSGVHSPPSIAENMNGGAISLLPLNVFVAL
jgi:hypothetical protein